MSRWRLRRVVGAALVVGTGALLAAPVPLLAAGKRPGAAQRHARRHHLGERHPGRRLRGARHPVRPRRARPAPRRRRARHLARRAGDPVRRAGDPTVSIVDFSFAPATSTIHIGDTITWVNGGRAPHTATATGGTFSTGTLAPGRSASHTFAQPGTYTYICAIHPFMHGRVVVLAAPAPQPSHRTPAAAAAPPPPSRPAQAPAPAPVRGAPQPAPPAGALDRTAESTGTLPFTGFDLTAPLAIGAALVLAGIGVRRMARRPLR